jgi:hypothetical protein
MLGGDGMDSILEYRLTDTCRFILLRPFVGGPSSLTWSGGVVFWYGVYGSLTIYRWRELVISKVFGLQSAARGTQDKLPS